MKILFTRNSALRRTRRTTLFVVCLHATYSELSLYRVVFYTTLGIFFMCLSSRENHDLEYSLNLPVRKRDLVGARILTVCILNF